MKQFIDSIEKSLEQENWYAALFMALAMPDICRSVERPIIAQGQTGYWYKKWFERYLLQKYSTGRFEETKFFAHDCWLFRCSCLHSGMDAENKQRLMKFSFTAPPLRQGACVHKNYIQGKLQLQIDIFCKDMIAAVETWLEEVRENRELQERIDSLLTINLTPLESFIQIS